MALMFAIPDFFFFNMERPIEGWTVGIENMRVMLAPNMKGSGFNFFMDSYGWITDIL